MSDRIERLERARLYLVCDAQDETFLRAALRGGVDVVQLRMKDAEAEEILASAERFRVVCAEHDALFILNDRPDLVTAAGADGVHVGQDDVPVAEARAAVGPDRIVGLSTHTPEQVDSATGERPAVAGEPRARGVDYVAVGPVHETPTKPGRPAVGLELVRYAATRARVPVFAIGGITTANAHSLRAAGATRIAVVRALTQATDPTDSARALRAAITAERARVGSA